MTLGEAELQYEAVARPVARRRPIRVVAPTASGRRWRLEGPPRVASVRELAFLTGRPAVDCSITCAA
jgi:hypothetical protein